MSPYHTDLEGLRKGFKILGYHVTDEAAESSREGIGAGSDARYNFEVATRKLFKNLKLEWLNRS